MPAGDPWLLLAADPGLHFRYLGDNFRDTWRQNQQHFALRVKTGHEGKTGVEGPPRALG